MIKKIKSSLLVKVFILTAIILTGMSFLVYNILAWYTPKTYSNTLNATLDEQTKLFVSEISQMPIEETGDFFDNFLDFQNVDRMELFEENGNSVNLPTTRTPDNDIVIETKDWGNEDYNAPIISNSYTVSFPGSDKNYTLVVYGSAGQIAELQKAFQKVLPLLVLIVFCVSFVTAWFFSYLITKPVLKISHISKQMSELQFEWQLEEQRTDELGILATSLNYLSQKLNITLSDLQAANKRLELDIEHEKALEQAQLDFFSAVSHELKTPITIIKGQIEGMLLGIGTYKDHTKYLTRSLEVANTLETMVQEILTISRLETTKTDFKKDCVDCVQIVKSYLNDTEDLITKKELQIRMDTPQNAYINANKMMITKAFSNLIGNAIKYSPQGESVYISIFTENEKVTFSIENTGTHIPEENISDIFNAFYRVDSSRSRKTGGSGLGLYVTQKILNQHGSSCTVQNTSSGVRFKFTI